MNVTCILEWNSNKKSEKSVKWRKPQRKSVEFIVIGFRSYKNCKNPTISAQPSKYYHLYFFTTWACDTRFCFLDGIKWKTKPLKVQSESQEFRYSLYLQMAEKHCLKCD